MNHETSLSQRGCISCDAKIEKNICQRKTIAQDNILVIQQFSIVYGVAMISLFTVKITRCDSKVFSLKTTTKP